MLRLFRTGWRATLGIVVVMVTLLTLAACTEDGVYGVTFITADQHTVGAGDLIAGDVLVFDGVFEVEPDGRVGRHLFVMGGEARIAGEVGGDVSALGGRLRIEDGARIAGSVSYSAGEVEIEPGAAIGGEVREGVGVEVPLSAGWQEASWRNQVGWAVGSTILMALFAGLVGWIRPTPLGRVARAAMEFPVPTGALGLLSLVASVILIVFMAFTVVLLPVSMLLLVFLGIGLVVYGLIGLGYAAGDLLARWSDRDSGPAVKAMAGTAGLTAALSVAQLVPLVGWVAPALALSVGSGAVLLTRFGARVFQPEPLDWDEPAEPEAGQRADENRSV